MLRQVAAGPFSLPEDMGVKSEELQIKTRGRGVYNITSQVLGLVQDWGIQDGLCNIFIRHTSASLMLCENADPAVLRDMERFMSRLVPDGDPLFEHDQEGPDDMPAHVRSVLTQSDMTIPIFNRKLDLGTWQGIFLWEQRSSGHTRSVRISVLGD